MEIIEFSLALIGAFSASRFLTQLIIYKLTGFKKYSLHAKEGVDRVVFKSTKDLYIFYKLIDSRYSSKDF